MQYNITGALLQIERNKMKKIILTTLIIFSSSIVAHDLPNTFEAGQPIVASEVNENFAELKSEIDQLKSQMETITTATNDKTEIVGLSDPAIWGNLGLVEGRAMCPSKFPSSKICLLSEVYTLEAYPTLSTNYPFAIIGNDTYDVENNDIYFRRNICSNFRQNTSNPSNSLLLIDENGIIDSDNRRYWSSYFPINNVNPVKEWMINNLTQVNSLGEADGLADSYYFEPRGSQGHYVYMSECAITVPAICCK